MIIYSEVDWNNHGIKQDRISKGIRDGRPLAFIIGDTVVDVLPTDIEFADLMESTDSFVDNAELSSEGAYAVDLIKNGQVLDTLICSEKTRAILLSNPVLVGWTKEKHKYAEIIDRGWKYIDGDFIIPGEFE